MSHAKQVSSRPAQYSLRLIQNFALVGRWNLELFPILRNRASGELQPLPLENADDFRVAERLSRVLLLDDLPDPLLDRDRRDRFPIGAVDPAMEEVLHL